MGSSTGQRLNQNGITQLLANAQTRVANEANELALMAQKPNLLLFTQPKLAQTTGDFGRSIETLYENGCAGHDSAQRA